MTSLISFIWWFTSHNLSLTSIVSLSKSTCLLSSWSLSLSKLLLLYFTNSQEIVNKLFPINYSFCLLLFTHFFPFGTYYFNSFFDSVYFHPCSLIFWYGDIYLYFLLKLDLGYYDFILIITCIIIKSFYFSINIFDICLFSLDHSFNRFLLVFYIL